MIKFTDDFMEKSLAYFGEDYKYPVYASMDCRRVFFRSYVINAGFVAVTDTEKLFVVEYSAFGTDGKAYVFSAQNLKKLKIRKLAFMPIYKIKSVFMANGSKFRLDIIVSLKVAGCDFASQAENAINFIETLKNWQN